MLAGLRQVQLDGLVREGVAIIVVVVIGHLNFKIR